MRKIQSLVSWILSLEERDPDALKERTKDGRQLLAVSLFLNVVFFFSVAALFGRNEGLHNTLDEREKTHAREMQIVNDRLSEHDLRSNEFLRQSIITAQQMKDSLFMYDLRMQELQNYKRKRR